MSKHILFISYDGLTDPLGQSQIIPYLAGLSGKGWSITIVSCEKHSQFNKLSALIRKVLQKSNIKWVPVSYVKSPPVLSTLYNLIRIYSASKKVIRQQPISILHCRSTLPAMIGHRLQKKHHAKLLFDMRGFWADERVEGNLWPLSNIIYRFIYKYIKKKERQLLVESNHLISLTHEGKRVIIEDMHIAVTPPVTVIPCCTDLELFDPNKYSSDEVLKRKTEIGIARNSFTICYTGSIGTWYMLPEMLAFYKVLLQRVPSASFLFVTMEDPEIVFTAAGKLNVPVNNIKIISAERNEVPLLIAVADASIFFIKQSFSKKASSPTKQGETLAMGIPIICNSGVGDSDYIVRFNKVGWVTSHFDDENYTAAINEMLSGNKPSKETIRKVAEENFSLTGGVESYNGVYLQLLQ